MTQTSPERTTAHLDGGARSILPALLFLTVAVVGLFYVKWAPYWHKGFLAAAHHSIGASILTGKSARPPAASWAAAQAYAWSYGKAIWQALVLGLLLGSGVQALLPVGWVARALGGGRFEGALKGGLLALPGMMCTCCAAVMVAGLRRRQASAGGALAFWLGNSVLNPATLVFIGFVLGWRWAALRLLVGAPLVFGLGYLANRLSSPEEAARAEAELAALAAAPQASPLRRWLAILGRMTVQLVPEYLVLVLLLGAGRAWLFPALGPGINDSLWWLLAFSLAGAVFVIPTAGEAPIIQAMMALGVGVGPLGALLLTLPPISLPSMAMLFRSFPPRVLAMTAGGVVLAGVASGALAIAIGL